MIQESFKYRIDPFIPPFLEIAGDCLFFTLKLPLIAIFKVLTSNCFESKSLKEPLDILYRLVTVDWMMKYQVANQVRSYFTVDLGYEIRLDLVSNLIISREIVKSWQYLTWQMDVYWLCDSTVVAVTFAWRLSKTIRYGTRYHESTLIAPCPALHWLPSLPPIPFWRPSSSVSN